MQELEIAYMLDKKLTTIRNWKEVPWWAEIAIKAAKAGLIDPEKDFISEPEVRALEIARIRRELDLSQDYMSVLVNRPQPVISGWERGKSPPLWYVAVLRALKSGLVERPRAKQLPVSLRKIKEITHKKMVSLGHNPTGWKSDGLGGWECHCKNELLDPVFYNAGARLSVCLWDECEFKAAITADKRVIMADEVCAGQPDEAAWREHLKKVNPY